MGLLIPLLLVAGLSGCALPAITPAVEAGATQPGITSIIPAAGGTPNYVTTLGSFAFVSVQGTGQIFTYNIKSGTPVQVGTAYATPCSYPSGMAITAINGANVMAVACYDTATLLTLRVNPNGSLSPLGSVAGLAMPYPGIVLDGTDVYVPLHGQSLYSNGGVAKVSIASPAAPSVTASWALTSPSSDVFLNVGSLALAKGNVFLLAGSENQPWATTSSLQVINASSMTAVGAPLQVDHSPQQIALHDDVAFVTFFDAEEFATFDITNPASVQPLQELSLASDDCTALSLSVHENFAYVGCHLQHIVEKIDISDPTDMQVVETIPDIYYPQRSDYSPLRYFMVTSAQAGGPLYQIDGGRF